MDNAHIEWAIQCLQGMGYELISQIPEEVQSTPWSDVSRFETASGDIYLKKSPKLIAHEASIIQILREQLNAPVPEIVGTPK